MTRAKKALSQAVLLISGAIMLGFGAMRGEVETVLSKNNQHERQCKTLCQITDLMGQDFFIVVYIACDGIDIIAGLSLGKPG